ncbi:hypothetical protein MHPYR_860001 [uncultured Mycobacterium sp.]|nr:hypothetical protein MHPYR_860001 [uncultured Mycobacterium sp.]
MVQITHPGPGRDYFQRRIDEGDSRQRALRSLKRRLARVVYARMKADSRNGGRNGRGLDPGRADYHSRRLAAGALRQMTQLRSRPPQRLALPPRDGKRTRPGRKRYL